MAGQATGSALQRHSRSLSDVDRTITLFVLGAAAVLVLPVALVLALVTVAVLRVQRWRWWYALAPSGLALLWLARFGVREAFTVHVAVYPQMWRSVWVEGAPTPWGSWAAAMLPFSAVVAGLVAAAIVWRDEHGRPRTRVEQIRRSRMHARAEHESVRQVDLDGHVAVAGDDVLLGEAVFEHLRAGRGVIVVDLHGRLARDDGLRVRVARAGHEVTSVNALGPMHWDPLAHGDARQCARRLVALADWPTDEQRQAAGAATADALRRLGLASGPTLAQLAAELEDQPPAGPMIERLKPLTAGPAGQWITPGVPAVDLAAVRAGRRLAMFDLASFGDAAAVLLADLLAAQAADVGGRDLAVVVTAWEVLGERPRRRLVADGGPDAPRTVLGGRTLAPGVVPLRRHDGKRVQ